MATYNPRIISNAIETLESEIQRFTDTSTETTQQASSIQANYRERVDRVLRWSAIVLDRAQEDTLEVRAVSDEIDRLLTQCSNAVDTAHHTLADSEKISTRAIATQNLWQTELQTALSWEAQAEEELKLAIIARNEAQIQVNIAKDELDSAKSDLSDCRSDSENDCSYEAGAVGAAKDSLNAARAELDLAKELVREAEEELERAQARVTKCRKSLVIATQAVDRSYVAIRIATESLVRAESSLSDANAAHRTAVEARSQAIEAEEFATETVTRSRLAESQVDLAKIQLYQAIKSNDSAHNLAIRAKLDLDYRNEQLRDFNRISSDIP